MAQIISGMQSKGGAGKSTLLCCLITVMSRDGAKILGIDADPQQTLLRFHDAGDDPIFDVISETEPAKLVPLVDAHRASYDAILIDTPGVESQLIVYAAAVSDLILIPTGPSEPDALGAVKTWDHVKATQAMRRGPPPTTFVIMNEYRPNTRVTAHINQALATAAVPLFRTGLPSLSGFKEMHSTGAIPDGAAGRALDDFIDALRAGDHLTYYTDRGRFPVAAKSSDLQVAV